MTPSQGPELAVKQCHFEAANLAATVEFIRELDLVEEVGLVTCSTMDVYMSEAVWENQLKSFAAFQAAGGDTSKIQKLDKEEAREVSFAVVYGSSSY